MTFSKRSLQKLKEELEKLYAFWQDIIDNGAAERDSWYGVHEVELEIKEVLEKEIISVQNFLRNGNLPEKSSLPLLEELDRLKAELNEKYLNFREECFRQVLDFRPPQMDVDVPEEEEQQGLTPQRIQQFEQFQADDSFVGDQCVICMEDIEIGRNMMRLDCDGQHTFCQSCIEGWLADHNTCPVCRHKF